MAKNTDQICAAYENNRPVWLSVQKISDLSIKKRLNFLKSDKKKLHITHVRKIKFPWPKILYLGMEKNWVSIRYHWLLINFEILSSYCTAFLNHYWILVKWPVARNNKWWINLKIFATLKWWHYLMSFAMNYSKINYN